MAELSNRRDLERWLNGRAHEPTVLIASRAALRALPLLTDWMGSIDGDAVLPVFRAAALSRVAAVWPERSRSLREAALANASSAAASLGVASPPAAAAYHALHAAYYTI